MYLISPGYVPQHRFTYGKTYKEGTEGSVAKFKYGTLRTQAVNEDLKNTVRSISKLEISKDHPRPDPSHPGVNVRYAYAHNGKHFGKPYFFLSPTVHSIESLGTVFESFEILLAFFLQLF